MAGEFHGSKNVGIHEITGDSSDKHIADATIKNVFDGHTRIDAAEHDGFGELAGDGFANLGFVIPNGNFTVNESLVAFFQHFQDIVRREFILLFFGQNVFDQAFAVGGYWFSHGFSLG
jgi:hypothetical protein